jgi:hypothetical protein
VDISKEVFMPLANVLLGTFLSCLPHHSGRKKYSSHT